MLYIYTAAYIVKRALVAIPTNLYNIISLVYIILIFMNNQSFFKHNITVFEHLGKVWYIYDVLKPNRLTSISLIIIDELTYYNRSPYCW